MLYKIIIGVLVHMFIFCINMALSDILTAKIGRKMRHKGVLVFLIPCYNLIAIFVLIRLIAKVGENWLFQHDFCSLSVLGYITGEDTGKLLILNSAKEIVLENITGMQAYLKSERYDEFEFKVAIFDFLNKTKYGECKKKGVWNNVTKEIDIAEV